MMCRFGAAQATGYLHALERTLPRRSTRAGQGIQKLLKCMSAGAPCVDL